ncbi:MAG: hypothetical protein GX621_12665, partial [Pirellulaceae bacterium]|nr:hypothetical protein [Pirellulaceae bacterium]
MTGPAGSSSTNRTWQSSHEQSREFHSEDWWTPLGGSHESTTLEGWSSGGEQSWSYSGPDGSWSIGGSWSDGSSPPAVEESWSWGTPPAGPLAAPEYAGPGDADYGDLISAIAVESLGAYNQPATRDAAVDAAIVAFVSLDAD